MIETQTIAGPGTRAYTRGGVQAWSGFGLLQWRQIVRRTAGGHYCGESEVDRRAQARASVSRVAMRQIDPVSAGGDRGYLLAREATSSRRHTDGERRLTDDTARLYSDVPFLAMLHVSNDELRVRAEKIIAALDGLPLKASDWHGPRSDRRRHAASARIASITIDLSHAHTQAAGIRCALAGTCRASHWLYRARHIQARPANCFPRAGC